MSGLLVYQIVPGELHTVQLHKSVPIVATEEWTGNVDS